MPIVYIAVNLVNGKRYIGVTKHNLKRRKYEHLWGASSGKVNLVFSKAIRKYGADAFEFSVLEEFSSHKEALAAEMRYIAELKPEYNVAAGGLGAVAVPWSKGRREKMIPALKRAWTAERKEKISSLFKKRGISPEHRQKLTAAARPDKLYKPVVCLNDGMTFPSVKHAATHYGIGNRGISEVLSGRTNRCGGLSFAYAKDISTDSDRLLRLTAANARIAANKQRILNGMRVRPVVALPENRTFRSAVEAAQWLGVSHSYIFYLCTTGRPSKGIRFMYADQEYPIEPKYLTDSERAAAHSLRVAALRRGQLKIKKSVVCLDNGLCYDSMSDAARQNRLNISALSAAILRNGKCGGMRFKYEVDL